MDTKLKAPAFGGGPDDVFAVHPGGDDLTYRDSLDACLTCAHAILIAITGNGEIESDGRFRFHLSSDVVLDLATAAEGYVSMARKIVDRKS